MINITSMAIAIIISLPISILLTLLYCKKHPFVERTPVVLKYSKSKKCYSLNGAVLWDWLKQNATETNPEHPGWLWTPPLSYGDVIKQTGIKAGSLTNTMHILEKAKKLRVHTIKYASRQYGIKAKAKKTLVRAPSRENDPSGHGW